jgi:hypothetical protein
MKISATLVDTLKLLSPNLRTRTISVETQILSIEAAWVVAELQQLVLQYNHHEATLANLTVFKDFLARRWERIKDISTLHFTVNYQLKVTQLLETLATDLARTGLFKNADAVVLHRYELLMPTLNYNSELAMGFVELDVMAEDNRQQALAEGNEGKEEKPTENSGPHRENIELRHFILDVHYRPIIIRDCLKAAAEDGILRHSYVASTDNRAVALSEKDRIRVTHHSREAFAFFNAINKHIKEKKNTFTAGGALQCFIDALYEGDLNHEGEEFQAGATAFAGIVRFNDFLESLAPADLQMLYKLSDTAPHYKTFKKSWFLLLGAAIENDEIEVNLQKIEEVSDFLQLHNSGIKLREKNCVWLLANYFKRVLDANKKVLYAMHSPADKIEQKQTTELEAREDEVTQASYRLWYAQNHLQLRHYAPSELGKKLQIVQKALSFDDYSYMRDFVASMVRSLDDLMNLVLAVADNDTREHLVEVYLDWGCVGKVVSGFNDFKLLFTQISADMMSLQNLLLKKFPPQVVKEWVLSSAALAELNALLCPSAFVVLRGEILGERYARRIARTERPATVTHATGNRAGFFRGVKRVASDQDLEGMVVADDLVFKRRRVGATALSISVPDDDDDEALEDLPLSVRIRR